MWSLTYQIGLFVGLPAAVLVAGRLSAAVRLIGPVFICYGLGLVLGNQSLVVFDSAIALQVSAACVALSIPLLLFSVDIIGWIRLAKSTVLSFSLAIVASTAAALLAAVLFRHLLPDSPKLAAMLTGVYIGGTPNMASIGTALGVPGEVFVKLNAADMVNSTIYMALVLTVAQRLLARVLPSFPAPGSGETAVDPPKPEGRARIKAIGLGLALSIAVVAVGWGAGKLVPKNAGDVVTLLAITTVAVALSSWRGVRSIPLTYETGFFLLLIFAVAVGTTARFSELMSSSLYILLFTATVVFTAVALHIALGALFRIDHDTLIITSVAAIWAPPVVPPVAAALRNKEVLVSGIASGLVGYAVANYIGLLVAWIAG